MFDAMRWAFSSGVKRRKKGTVGFIAAFLASVVVVRPFLAFVRRAGFAPFAWYRIVIGLALFAALKFL